MSTSSESSVPNRIRCSVPARLCAYDRLAQCPYRDPCLGLKPITLSEDVVVVACHERVVTGHVVGKKVLDIVEPPHVCVIESRGSGHVLCPSALVMPLTEGPQRCSSKFPTSGGAEVSRSSPPSVGRIGR